MTNTIRNMFRIIVVTALVIVILQISGAINLPILNGLIGYRVTSESLLEILRSEPVILLVTDRVPCTITLAEEEYNHLMGKHEILATISVVYLFGMDMEELNSRSIVAKGDTLIVTLPEIKVLEIAPNLSSLEVVETMTGLWKLYLVGTGYNATETILRNLDQKISGYASANDLLPTRNEVLSRLHDYYSNVIKSQTFVVFQ